jgi:hypothetical protein
VHGLISGEMLEGSDTRSLMQILTKETCRVLPSQPLYFGTNSLIQRTGKYAAQCPRLEATEDGWGKGKPICCHADVYKT